MCVGLLATEATLVSDLYVDRGKKLMPEKAIDWRLPTADEITRWIVPGIAAVKAGDTRRGRLHLARAARALVARGATRIILGCTEIPLVLDQRRAEVPLINASEALARRTVAWALGALLAGRLRIDPLDCACRAP